MSEVDVAAKRAARLKRAKAEAAGSDAVDATSSQDGGRVMSSFRMEPLEMGSEGRPRGVYDSGPPPRGVSRLEMLFFYTYVSIAMGGTVPQQGYYWYKVRACPPHVSTCVPLRRRWVAHDDTPVTWRSSHTHDCRLEPLAPFEPGPSDPPVDAQGRMPGCDRHSHTLPRLLVMIACPS
jgi:hypothetical protein